MSATNFDAWRLERRRPEVFARARQRRPDIDFIELDTTWIRLRVTGNGPTTIVFACDPPNVIEQFDELVALLETDFRVACYEQPGFGFSYPKPAFDFTRPAYAAALEDLLGTLVGPVVPVAPCISSYATIEVGRRRPDLVSRLVLMQAPAWEREREWVSLVARGFARILAGLAPSDAQIDRMARSRGRAPGLAAVPYLGQLVTAATERRFARRTHPFAVHDSARRPEVLARFLDGARVCEEGACNCFASLLQRYFREPTIAVSGLSQEVLLLWGIADPTHRYSDRRGLARALAASGTRVTSRELPATGHHLELENPRGVAEAIREFLGR